MIERWKPREPVSASKLNRIIAQILKAMRINISGGTVQQSEDGISLTVYDTSGDGGGSDLADYDPDAGGANGTLTLAKPIYMAWWDGDEGASGAYEELLEAADTTYTGSGNYLCAKLDLTQSYGSRWSVARYATNKVSASDDDAKYWCLGKIVDDVFEEWTFVIEHMGS